MSRITLNSGIQHQYTPSGSDIEGNVHLDKLSDVTVTSVQNNQILKYDSSQNQWVNTLTGDVTSLDSLTDVTITAVQDGQSLQYNSTTGKWENADIVASSVDGGTY
jgi:hypothetical protein